MKPTTEKDLKILEKNTERQYFFRGAPPTRVKYTAPGRFR